MKLIRTILHETRFVKELNPTPRHIDPNTGQWLFAHPSRQQHSPASDKRDGRQNPFGHLGRD